MLWPPSLTWEMSLVSTAIGRYIKIYLIKGKKTNFSTKMVILSRYCQHIKKIDAVLRSQNIRGETLMF